MYLQECTLFSLLCYICNDDTVQKTAAFSQFLFASLNLSIVTSYLHFCCDMETQDNKNQFISSQFQAYCGVCGEKATGHYYYGGLSCFSCRTFFRRCVFKSTLNSCREKSCIITESTRASCQYCRFQKCLSIGMDPDLVSPENPKKPAEQSNTNMR